MSKGNIKESQDAEIKKLYEPDFFYDHGDNPANKKLIEVAAGNHYKSGLPEFRSYIFDNKARWFMARGFDDFLQRDLKVWTAPRALAVWASVSFWYLGYIGMTRRLLPVGRFGITKLSQTPFYHRVGRIPTYLVAASPYIAFYIWFRISSFCTRRLWNNIVLQEREWSWEKEREPYYGHYYFADAPLSCEESFPAQAFGEISKGGDVPKPEWA